jgi:hypothetical protein
MATKIDEKKIKPMIVVGLILIMGLILSLTFVLLPSVSSQIITTNAPDNSEPYIFMPYGNMAETVPIQSHDIPTTTNISVDSNHKRPLSDNGSMT